MKRVGRVLRDRRGIAIIIVLMITTLMTVMILDLHQSVRINFYIANNLVGGVKAEYLLRSAMQVASGILLRDIQDNSVDYFGEDWYDFLGKAGMPGIPISEDETLMMDINDESGRFNLNNMVDNHGKPYQPLIDVLKQILTNQGLDPKLANAIVDYISAGTDALDGSGAKDSVYGYSSMTPPTTAKCSRFESIQEVRLVTGITDEIWGQLEPLVSIYGDPKMNLNTVDANIITAVLQTLNTNADPSLSEKIDQWRRQGADGSSTPSFGQSDSSNYFTVKNMSSQLQTLGMDAKTAGRFVQFFGVASHYFRVTCTALVSGVQKNALGIIGRTTSKASVIYFRVAPGVAASSQAQIGGQGTPSPLGGSSGVGGAGGFGAGNNGTVSTKR
jgi:general secretion pathway protein K